MKSTYLEIQDGGEPPNLQSLNGYPITRACIDRFRSNLAEFQHVTVNTPLQGQRVKGQGHSVRNRQHGFTAKFVGLSYLFNLTGGRVHGHATPMVARRSFPKAIFSNKKTQQLLIICQIDWREVGVAFELQCLRNCTRSSYLSFVSTV